MKAMGTGIAAGIAAVMPPRLKNYGSDRETRLVSEQLRLLNLDNGLLLPVVPVTITIMTATICSSAPRRQPWKEMQHGWF